MSEIEDILDHCDSLLRIGKQQEPHNLLNDLIDTAGRDELDTWKHDIRRLIAKFMPKRKALLSKLFERKLNGNKNIHEDIDSERRNPPEDNASLEADKQRSSLLVSYQSALDDLASSHIFQWSTYYRDTITEYTQYFLDSSIDSSNSHLDKLTEVTKAHANHIFVKGYEYKGSWHSRKVRLDKTLSGLERFLELPLESYVSILPGANYDLALRLRRFNSALILGILLGYSSSRFDNDQGSAILPRFPRSWANFLGFLTSQDLIVICETLEPGDFRDGLTQALIPSLMAIDQIITDIHDYFAGPLLCEFNWSNRRLEITLQEPPDASEFRRIQFFCVLDDTFFSARDLEEADRVGVALIVSNLRADLEKYVSEHQQQTLSVIGITQGDSESTSRRIRASLDEIIYGRRSKRGSHIPLSYNFAREFPLRDPRRRRFFHVPRSSVRDLLKIFERRNGIRLWCSVRRSGKTTACFDLTSSESQSVVVSQTCDSTDPHAGANIFYDGVVDALGESKQIQKSFVFDLVKECAPKESSRYVLVIDEYETLFHRLRAALHKDPDLRYVIIQPLLNQLVAFSQENLLVFLGQQPNVHYMMMDQNQLSAYVQQDAFPLFNHVAGTTVGEFSELMRKVFTDRVSFDSGFADAIFEETAGHPYLTVNLLVEIVEWLIDTKRPRQNLRLFTDDFSTFRGERLTAQRIKLTSEYDFFREAAGEALGPYGKKETPWLHAAYSLLKRLSREDVTAWVSLGDVADQLKKMRIPESVATPESLVRSLAGANFLEIKDEAIRPKIRLLGRICATTTPKRS